MYKIVGYLSPINKITGRLTLPQTLIGQLTTPQVIPPDVYEGEYIITPKAYELQTLETENKLLEGNVVVLEVPYFEVDNVDGGRTVSIAYLQKGDKNG